MQSKIRFREKKFKKQLKQASGFKRRPSLEQNTRLKKFLAGLGLGNGLKSLLGLIFLSGIFYLVYFPSFLSVKEIVVQAENPDFRALIEKNTRSYISAKFFLPRKNLLFINKSSLRSFLLQDGRVLNVTGINREFFGKLVVQAEERIPALIFKSTAENFLVSSDGFVLKKTGEEPTESEKELLSVVLESREGIVTESFLPDADLAKKILEIAAVLKNKLNLKVSKVFFKDFSDSDFIVYTDLGEYYFDRALEVEKTGKDLVLLWQNLTEEQKQKLLYADMRVYGRGYVCYKDSECANPPEAQVSTSTSDIIINP